MSSLVISGMFYYDFRGIGGFNTGVSCICLSRTGKVVVKFVNGMNSGNNGSWRNSY